MKWTPPTREAEAAQRLMAIPGVGPVTATALVASAGQASEFKNGRHFAAWLGLVPRQYSTGGKLPSMWLSEHSCTGVYR